MPTEPAHCEASDTHRALGLDDEDLLELWVREQEPSSDRQGERRDAAATTHFDNDGTCIACVYGARCFLDGASRGAS